MDAFIISVGGTGAKVTKAIINLCASGLINLDRIHILFVDQDQSNGNLTDARAHLSLYNEIQNFPVFGDTPIFKTKIIDYGLWIPALKDKNFVDVVKYNLLYDEEKYLIKTLFDKNEALGESDESKMIYFQDGFIGRPAFGSVAFSKNLNDETLRNEPWGNFVRQIQISAASEPPMIFLIGSIFGGTGASGIPTIAQRLKEYLPRQKVDNFKINGIILFPYFIFTTPGDEEHKFAQAFNFNLKTFIAIKYYEQLLKNTFNYLYFIGLEKYQTVESAPGGPQQRNEANITELYSALALYHAISNRETQNRFYLIGRNSDERITWTDIPYNAILKPKLSSFLRFSFIFSSLIYPVIVKRDTYKPSHIPWLFDYIKTEEISEISTYREKIKKFSDNFIQWIAELTTSTPIDIDIFDKKILKDLNDKIKNKEQLPTPLENMVNIIKENKDLYRDADQIWAKLCKDHGSFNDFIKKLYELCSPKIKGGV
jgi:hypothetical protein